MDYRIMKSKFDLLCHLLFPYKKMKFQNLSIRPYAQFVPFLDIISYICRDLFDF